MVFVLLAVDAAGQGMGDCSDCHRSVAESFSRSAMSRAAINPVFLAEWRDKGHDPACLGCHAPSTAAGVACVDCHGPGGHPYAPVAVPDTCGRCHDAPGEVTVRSFRDSSAARNGKTCLDCHLGGNQSHVFIGPSDPAYLRDVASLRLALAGDRLMVAIRHRAGHSLPGGTTGRAAWLVVQGRDGAGAITWQERRRFGWLNAESVWQDNTLPPDRGVMIEIENPGLADSVEVTARLLYSRRAGVEPDSGTGFQELSRATMILR
ncbi:hypothetical protein [Magnetospirillum sp. 64-120]|uniref:hypothetical protein n=1 Tax=Magnetospirillum sp. 64-120 TaxID=1895778 RepID=UPI000928711D|nr:hypothetical protein [Magnetospirillum sp. 64-120]OJX78601.1 MAG: hypothetical protein BGO92_01800 [Magnetospirillum sp. 64-120]